MKINKTISIATAALMLVPMPVNAAEKQKSDFPQFDKNEVNGTVTLRIPDGVTADVEITLDSPEGKAFPYYTGTYDGGNDYSFDIEGRDNTADDYRIYNLSVTLCSCDFGGQADTFTDIINGNDERSFKVADANDHPDSFAEYTYIFEVSGKECNTAWEITKSDKVSKTVTVYANCISKVKLGDMNDDGVIDATDASAILSAYALSSVGQDTLTKEQKTAADVNKDGVVDATDASAVLTYYALSSVSQTGTFEEYMNSLNPTATTTTTSTTTTTVTTTTTTAPKTTTTSKDNTAATTTKSTATTTKATATTTKATATTTKAATTTTKATATTTKASTTAQTTTTAVTTFSPELKMENMNVIFAVMSGAPKYADNTKVTDGYIKVTDKNFSSVADVEKLINSTCTGQLQKSLLEECKTVFKETDGGLYVEYVPRSYYQFHMSKGLKITTSTATEISAVTVEGDAMNGYGKAVFSLENNEWKISAYEFFDYTETTTTTSTICTATTTVQTTVPVSTTTVINYEKAEIYNIYSFTAMKENRSGYLEKLNGADVITFENADGTYTSYQYVNGGLISKKSAVYEGTSSKMTADVLYKACLDKAIENGYDYNRNFKKTSSSIGYVHTESGGLRIRTTPDTSTYENILAELPSGLFFNILDDTNPEWFYVKVYYNGLEITGYIYKGYTVL